MTQYKVTKIGKVSNPKHPNSNYGDSQPFFTGTMVNKLIVIF